MVSSKNRRECSPSCALCCTFFFSSRRRHTRCLSDWSSDVCSSDLAGADSGPIHSPPTAAVGGNGMYHYGPAGSFPDQSFNGTNYWVDVMFKTSAPDTTRSEERRVGKECRCRWSRYH